MDIFRHFWLLCAVWCGIGNAIYFRRGLRQSITDKRITEKEANRSTVVVLLIIFVPCMIFWVLQMTSGPQATHDSETWQPIQRNIEYAVMVIYWISLIVWVWLLRGAESISKYFNLAGHIHKFTNHPLVFKGIVLLGAYFFIKG